MKTVIIAQNCTARHIAAGGMMIITTGGKILIYAYQHISLQIETKTVTTTSVTGPTKKTDGDMTGVVIRPNHPPPRTPIRMIRTTIIEVINILKTKVTGTKTAEISLLPPSKFFKILTHFLIVNTRT